MAYCFVMSPWQRPDWTSRNRPGLVEWIIFAEGDAPEPLPLSRSRHGMPSEGGALALQVTRLTRDSNWMSAQAEADLAGLAVREGVDDAVAAIARAQIRYQITADITDTDDLGYFQGCWAIARCLWDYGASVLIDLAADRAWASSDVTSLRTDAAFDVLREISLVIEDTVPCVVFTRGLGKFAHADLAIADVDERAVADIAVVVRDIANMVARGVVIDPRDELDLGTFSLRAEIMTPDLVTRLDCDADTLRLRAVPPSASA